MSAQDGNETTGGNNIELEKVGGNDQNQQNDESKNTGSFLDNRTYRLTVYLVVLFLFAYPSTIAWNNQIDLNEDSPWCNESLQDVTDGVEQYYSGFCGLSATAYQVTTWLTVIFCFLYWFIPPTKLMLDSNKCCQIVFGVLFLICAVLVMALAGYKAENIDCYDEDSDTSWWDSDSDDDTCCGCITWGYFLLIILAIVALGVDIISDLGSNAWFRISAYCLAYFLSAAVISGYIMDEDVISDPDTIIKAMQSGYLMLAIGSGVAIIYVVIDRFFHFKIPIPFFNYLLAAVIAFGSILCVTGYALQIVPASGFQLVYIIYPVITAYDLICY